ncbi:hypothetical protein [Paenibacillus lentus]|uniref:Uncharacterized protein n=1 Tax=Paenibacillus lentus TaxID=1338368 RepID=A0A3S8RQP9_9BACL|nr:hypothetical protein [Paenibacillus lentus]AZK45258.1 hypothetical protein EIM92_02785 [Paenibacillus lentus]
MELQTRSAKLAQAKTKRLSHRVGRALMMLGAAVVGAIVIIAIVLSILFFSGETQEFIYMNF